MIVVVMGVTGAGKTTVGRLLAARLDAAFLDADDYHPEANVAKMRGGTPLTDADRWPWLARLNAALRAHAARGAAAVLACSALKASYREALLGRVDDARLVYLRGSRETIAARLAGRRGHYMDPALLDSQFAALEEPTGAIVAEVEADPAAVVAVIAAQLTRVPTSPPPRDPGAA
jgi:gluconokinase